MADIRDHFDRANQTEPADILESRNADGPLILDGFETPPDLESILSDVPPQDIANKLVSRYFNGVEFPTGRSHKFYAVMDCKSDEVYSYHTYIRRLSTRRYL